MNPAFSMSFDEAVNVLQGTDAGRLKQTGEALLVLMSNPEVVSAMAVFAFKSAVWRQKTDRDVRETVDRLIRDYHAKQAMAAGCNDAKGVDDHDYTEPEYDDGYGNQS